MIYTFNIVIYSFIIPVVPIYQIYNKLIKLEGQATDPACLK